MAGATDNPFGQTAPRGLAIEPPHLLLELSNQDYALLLGSVGLFVVLALIMFFTRRVDWYGDRAAAER